MDAMRLYHLLKYAIKPKKSVSIYKEILHLSKLLCICKVIDSNCQEYVEKCVWLFVV